MLYLNDFGRTVSGRGDEEIPWWLAPHVRDYAALAKSSAPLQHARADGPTPHYDASGNSVRSTTVIRPTTEFK